MTLSNILRRFNEIKCNLASLPTEYATIIHKLLYAALEGEESCLILSSYISDVIKGELYEEGILVQDIKVDGFDDGWFKEVSWRD